MTVPPRALEGPRHNHPGNGRSEPTLALSIYKTGPLHKVGPLKRGRRSKASEATKHGSARDRKMIEADATPDDQVSCESQSDGDQSVVKRVRDSGYRPFNNNLAHSAVGEGTLMDGVQPTKIKFMDDGATPKPVAKEIIGLLEATTLDAEPAVTAGTNSKGKDPAEKKRGKRGGKGRKKPELVADAQVKGPKYRPSAPPKPLRSPRIWQMATGCS